MKRLRTDSHASGNREPDRHPGLGRWKDRDRAPGRRLHKGLYLLITAASLGLALAQPPDAIRADVDAQAVTEALAQAWPAVALADSR